MRFLGLTSCSWLLLFAAGCGGNVIVDAASGGAGGSVTGTGGASSSSSASGGAGGSIPGCSGAYFQLVVDNTPVSLTSGCSGTGVQAVPFPYAQAFEGGPDTFHGSLTIEGCTTDAPQSQGIVIRLDGPFAPGMYVLGVGVGTAAYTDAAGDATTTIVSPFEVDISGLGMAGGLVVGSFQGVVSQNGFDVVLDGKFAVCRVHDVDFN
jgi:hypothetical protein